MMNTHFFSVTIPAYKRKYLKECIDSILSQTYHDFELIIVNDASPEDLDSVVRQYSDSRIRYYVNEKNCGAINVVDNWNKCLEYAKGEFIICMGDDDKLLPNCLEEYSKLINKYPDLGVYHALTEIIDEKSQFFKMQQPRPEYEGCLSLAYNRWKGRSQYIGDFCFNTDKLRADGGFFFLPLAWASDDITAVRAARYMGIANTQVPCFQYRVNRLSISTTGSIDIKIDTCLQEGKWYKDFLESYKDHEMTSVEQHYYYLMINELPSHIRNRIRPGVTDALIQNPSRILYWLKKCDAYNLSKKDVFICFLLALGNITKITKRKY